MISLRVAYYSLRDALRTVYEHDEAEAVSHEAMQYITKLNKLQRLTNQNTPLNEAEFSNFQRIKSALKRGVPFQYATGEALFMGRVFSVGPSVLIPRPETEELVEWILQDKPLEGASVLDIGTGSGCIAISLKLERPDLDITGIDVSDSALEVAYLNKETHNVDISLLEADILDEASQKTLGSFDIIVSNPPYIPYNDRETMHTNVKDNEPSIALFVPDDDPQLFYRTIAEFGLDHLRPDGTIYCELHRDHAVNSEAVFKAKGYASVLVKEDFNGISRMLRARR